MTVTYIDATSSFGANTAAISIPKPAGAQVGDYMLAIITRSGSHSSLASVPSNFTLVGNLVASTTNTQWVYKGVVAAGDGSTYDFELASSSTVWTAAIAFYRGTVPATPVDASAQDNESSVSDTTIPVPALTTSFADDMEVALISHATPSDVTATYSAPDGTYSQRVDVQGTASGKRNSVIYDKLLSALNPASFNITSTEAGVHVATAVALMGEQIPTETLRPTATRNVTGLTPNTDPSAFQTIDDDPDDALTDFLVGTDPSGVPPNIARRDGADNAGNPTTSATATIPATAVDGDILLAFAPNAGATAAGSISDNSGVGSWAQVQTQAGTAMAGTVWWKRITNQTTERSKIVTVSGMTDSTCLNISLWSGCVTSGSPIDGTPVSENNASANNTQAGITTVTDGAMVIQAVFYSDNTAVTTNFTATSPSTLEKRTEIYSSGGGDSGLAVAASVKPTAGATGNISWSPGTNQISVSIAFALKPHFVAGATTNTKVEAIMSDPVDTLATGAGTGEIRMRIKKLGNGSNPSVRAEIHENASATVLATPIANTAVSDTSANGILLSGTFDQSVITNPANVEVWIIGTGAAGGLVEVGSVEWVAETSETATVGNTRAISYDVRALSGNTRQIRYDLRGLSGNTRALSYDLRALAGNARQILYDLRAPAGNTRGVLYNVSGLTGNQRAVLYNVLTRAGNSRVISYDLRALAGNQRQILYDLGGAVGNTRAILFDVSSRSGNTRQIRYDISALAGNTRQVRYDLRALAGNTREVLYDILADVLLAGNARILRFDIRALSGNTRALNYDVRALSGNTRQLRYDLRALAGNARPVVFDVLSRAGNTRIVLYDTRGLATQSRQVRYDVRGLSGNSRVLAFNVAALAGNQREIRYDIRGRAGNTRQILYDLLSQALLAGNSRVIRFDLRALAGNTRPVLFDVYNRSGNTRQIRYDVLTKAGNSRIIRYDLRALAGNGRPILFDVRAFAGNTRDVGYDVNTLVSTLRQVRYDIYGRTGNARQILFDIEAAEYILLLLEAEIIRAGALDAGAVKVARLEDDVIKASRLEPQFWALG